MLAIANKRYLFQGALDMHFDKALTHIKKGMQAFEFSKKKMAVQKLVQAYNALPENEKSIAISADIVESLIQLKAYAHASHIAEKIEMSVALKHAYTKTDHVSVLRAYSNLAQAYAETKDNAMARRYYHKALDHIFDSEQEPDLELVTLFMHKLEMTR